MKKYISIFFVIMFAILITGCGSKNEEIEVVVDKEKELDEYLIENGWEQDSIYKYKYTLTIRNTLDGSGVPINVDQYFLDTQKMHITRITRISQLSSTTTDYSLKDNIATGTYIILNETDEWETFVSYTYDFDNDDLIIDNKSFSKSCTEMAVNVKEKLEEIIDEANLNIDDFL